MYLSIGRLRNSILALTCSGIVCGLLALAAHSRAAAATLQTLHTFSAQDSYGHNADGQDPFAGLVLGLDGTMYGTTEYGGVYGGGTLYKVRADGSGFLSLHSFSALDSRNHNPDGAAPCATLTVARAGIVYGTTLNGGAYGTGTVFKVHADGSGFSTIHTFLSDDGRERNAGGAYPHGGLVAAPDNTMYGATSQGGPHGNGTIFKVSADGSGFQSLYSFTASNSTGRNVHGTSPDATLILAQNGYLYGTAHSGGSFAQGTVFKVRTNGVGFRTLHSFSSMTDGLNPDGGKPEAALIFGTGGCLYGTTQLGGLHGNGTLFKIRMDGTKFRSLHSFSHSDPYNRNTDGAGPQAALTLGHSGLLYGTTCYGGPHGAGTVFVIHTDGTRFRTIASFSDRDGANPEGQLLLGPYGNLYGTTFNGGVHETGTVYRILMGGADALLPQG